MKIGSNNAERKVTRGRTVLCVACQSFGVTCDTHHNTKHLERSEEHTERVKRKHTQHHPTPNITTDSALYLHSSDHFVKFFHAQVPPSPPPPTNAANARVMGGGAHTAAI